MATGAQSAVTRKWRGVEEQRGLGYHGRRDMGVRGGRWGVVLKPKRCSSSGGFGALARTSPRGARSRSPYSYNTFHPCPMRSKASTATTPNAAKISTLHRLQERVTEPPYRGGLTLNFSSAPPRPCLTLPHFTCLFTLHLAILSHSFCSKKQTEGSPRYLQHLSESDGRKAVCHASCYCQVVV